MTIIQQLAQIESRANTYNNQRALHIYPKHPVAGAISPINAFNVRVPYENAADKSNALLLLELFKEKGICASLSFPDGNINNFKFLPRQK